MCRDVVPVGAEMRRPIPSVVSPTSWSRRVTSSSLLCVHTDDVAGHPLPTTSNALHSVSVNKSRRTVTVLESGNQRRSFSTCRCRAVTEVFTAKLNGQCQLQRVHSCLVGDDSAFRPRRRFSTWMSCVTLISPVRLRRLAGPRR